MRVDFRLPLTPPTKGEEVCLAVFAAKY